ncbi:hypothetical protein N665_0155s0009 [Sinapis alba]|nr:hypothetical protein N665_0155s0009 [Sinapis alba]
MATDDMQTPPCHLPERIFALGAEPTGVRVTPYHKADGIRIILNALDREEVEKIRVSPFGKLIEIADKPKFSGRFGRYIISKQLKMSKKHEAWFLFAENPIRFSLRKFALLFGTLKEVPVSSVVRMLKKKLIKNLDTFFEFPWGMVSFDLLLSSIKERNKVSLSQNIIMLKGFVLSLHLVIVEYVSALTEVVQDGSSSGSDGECGDEDDISENVIGGSNVTEEYDWSDDEDDVGVTNIVKLIEQSFPFTQACFVGGASRQDVSRMREESKAVLINRKTVKTKTNNNFQPQDGVDAECLASIIGDKLKQDILAIQNSILTMQESFSSFKTTILNILYDVVAKVEDNGDKVAILSRDICNLPRRGNAATVDGSNRPSCTVEAGTQTMPDASTIIGEAMDFASRSTKSFAASLIQTYTQVDNTGKPVTEAHNKTPLCTHEQQSCNVTSNTNTDSTLDPGLLFPNPTFSLGLTQEAHMAGARNHCLNNNGDQEDSDEDNVEASEEEAVDEDSGEATEQAGVVDVNLESTVDEVTIGCRKSKRQKVPTKSLLGAYECDRDFLNRVRKAVADTIYNGGHIDYAAKFSLLLDKLKGSFCVLTERGNIQSTEVHQIIERSTHMSPKVVNILISHIDTLFRSQPHPQQTNNCVFMDMQFVSQLSKMYTKFSKSSKKDGFKFTASVVESIQQDPSKSDVGRFYFPFNLDQKYWVGICVDCISWSVMVLDYNTALRTDYLMNKEVRPIAQMFPYLLKQAGRQVGLRECKAMAIERSQTIPQQNKITDSGVETIIFIQAHAVGGVEVCKCITPDVLHTEVEQLGVSLYEANVGTL